MPPREITDQFHYVLQPELDKLVAQGMTRLVMASAETADSLGLKVAREQGYIRAVQDIIELGFAVERKLYGRPDLVPAGDD